MRELMALDPQLLMLLESMPKMPDGPLDYPALREQSALMPALLAGPSGLAEVASVENHLLYAEGADIPIRVYRPCGDAVGTMHYLHGGGWALGNLETVDHTARRLCRDLSMVIVTSTYRLAPEMPFPASFDDALEASKWVLENTNDLGSGPINSLALEAIG